MALVTSYQIRSAQGVSKAGSTRYYVSNPPGSGQNAVSSFRGAGIRYCCGRWVQLEDVLPRGRDVSGSSKELDVVASATRVFAFHSALESGRRYYGGHVVDE